MTALVRSRIWATAKRLVATEVYAASANVRGRSRLHVDVAAAREGRSQRRRKEDAVAGADRERRRAEDARNAGSQSQVVVLNVARRSVPSQGDAGPRNAPGLGVARLKGALDLGVVKPSDDPGQEEDANPSEHAGSAVVAKS